MTRYDQKGASNLIVLSDAITQLLSQEDFKKLFISEIRKKQTLMFKDFIFLLCKLIYESQSISLETKKLFNSRIRIRDNSWESDTAAFNIEDSICVIFLLFLSSKGLERKGYAITDKFYSKTLYLDGTNFSYFMISLGLWPSDEGYFRGIILDLSKFTFFEEKFDFINGACPITYDGNKIGENLILQLKNLFTFLYDDYLSQFEHLIDSKNENSGVLDLMFGKFQINDVVLESLKKQGLIQKI